MESHLNFSFSVPPFESTNLQIHQEIKHGDAPILLLVSTYTPNNRAPSPFGKDIAGGSHVTSVC